HARNEAADMRPEGDARFLDRTEEPAHHLYREPEPEHDDRRYIKGTEQDERKGNEENADAAPRVEQKIGAKHTGNRPARTDQRHRRCGHEKGMGKRGGDTRREIEDDEADAPHGEFD